MILQQQQQQQGEFRQHVMSEQLESVLMSSSDWIVQQEAAVKVK